MSDDKSHKHDSGSVGESHEQEIGDEIWLIGSLYCDGCGKFLRYTVIQKRPKPKEK